MFGGPEVSYHQTYSARDWLSIPTQHRISRGSAGLTQRITGILDKIDEYRRNWLSHLQRMPQNRIPLKSYHYRPQEGEQLEDRRRVGASSCNSGDRTDQRVQSLMFMTMMISGMTYKLNVVITGFETVHTFQTCPKHVQFYS